MNIAQYFDLNGLDKVRQQQFVGTLTDYILARMSDQIGEHLTEDEIDELELLSSNADPDAVIDWLNIHVPNFSAGVQEILEDERAVMKLNFKAVASLVG